MSNNRNTELITIAGDNSAICFDARSFSGSNESRVEILWLQVLAGDRDAYESIQELFYPVLFRYTRFMTTDIDLIDAVTEEVFSKCWSNKISVNGKRLLIELIREMRQEFLIRSYVDFTDEPDFLEREISFLNQVLKIEWDGVLQIMQIENYRALLDPFNDSQMGWAYS